MNVNTELLKKCIKTDSPTIVEIGCADGEGSKTFLDLWENVKLYSFDADPRAISCHSESVKDKRCSLINKAVSNEVGTINFHLSNKTSQHDAKLQRENRKEIFEKATEVLKEVCPEYTPTTPTHGGWFYSSTILEDQNNGARGINWYRSVEVEVTTIDEWCKENKIKHIDLLWTDVEGAERKLIQGSKNSFKFIDYILLEYGLTDMFPEAMNKEETISLMEENDFEMFEEWSDIDLLFKRKGLDNE